MRTTDDKKRSRGGVFCHPSSALRPLKGAIAQLGERLLCKQEVVGSIPSGSTRSACCNSALRGCAKLLRRCAGCGVGSLWRLGQVRPNSKKDSYANGFARSLYVLFDIVKRR